MWGKELVVKQGDTGMQNRRFITLLFAVAVATASSLVAAAPAQAFDTIVKLVSQSSGKCLQPMGGSTEQGTLIVQVTCNGSIAQQWTDHNGVHLINRASGLCLNAHGPNTAGTPIDQWTCNTISNENWGYGITNNLLASHAGNGGGNCIASPGFPDGLAVQLRFCNGDISQLWSRPNG